MTFCFTIFALLCIQIKAQTDSTYVDCALTFYSNFFKALNLNTFDSDTYKIFISPSGTQGSQLYKYLLARETLIICQLKTPAGCSTELANLASSKTSVSWFLELTSATAENLSFTKYLQATNAGTMDIASTAQSVLTYLQQMKCDTAGTTKAALYKAAAGVQN